MHRDAPLTLSGFLRKPTGAKSGPGPDEGRTAVEAIERVEPEALEPLKTGLDVGRPRGRRGPGCLPPGTDPLGPRRR